MNTETQNYKIIVAYDGTRYKGWQVQKSTDDTIQGKLQHVLSTLAGKPGIYKLHRIVCGDTATYL